MPERISDFAPPLDGLDLHVEGEGSESIVMIHGWPDTYRLWEEQVAALKAHYRCIRFTLPGFNISQPPRAYSMEELHEVFKAVIETTCPDRQVILMLHDWGCLFGYQFALRHPALVSKIVGIDVGDAGSRAHLRSLALWAKLAIFSYQVWLALAWRVGGRLGDWMSRSFARAFSCPADPRYIGSAMNYPYYIQWTGLHGSYGHLPEFKPACPMLYLYGLKKPLQFHSPAWTEELVSQPGHRVVALEAAHWLMVEKAAQFNTVVLEWLRATL